MSYDYIEDKSHDKSYDLVIWDATSILGQQVALYISKIIPKNFRWGLASHCGSELRALKLDLASICSPTILQIDPATYSKCLWEIISDTSILINVKDNPSQMAQKVLYFCMQNNTHYIDYGQLDMDIYKGMMSQYHLDAEKKRIFLIPFCGFQSVPFDLGSYWLVNYVKENYLCDVATVSGIIKFKGNMKSPFDLEKKKRKHTLRQNIRDWGECVIPKYIPRSWNGVWTLKHLEFNNTNEAVVKRTNALMRGSYGKNFKYDEGFELSFKSKTEIVVIILMQLLFLFFYVFPVLRKLLSIVHKPNRQYKPQKVEVRANNWFEIKMIAEVDKKSQEMQGFKTDSSVDIPEKVFGVIKGGDASVDETARFLGEIAVMLASGERSVLRGGVVTPAALFGMKLVEKLVEKGVSFSLLNEDETVRGKNRKVK